MEWPWLYVDDRLLLSKSKNVIDTIIAVLKSEFETEENGRYFGMEISRDENTSNITIKQEQYISISKQK